MRDNGSYIALFDMISISAAYPPNNSAYGWYPLGTSTLGSANIRYAKINAQTLSWYDSSGATYQMNSSGAVYNYVAIG